MALSETAKRVGVAVAGIPVAVGAVYLGGFVLGGLLAIISTLAVLEFFRMAERKVARPLVYLGAAGAAGLVLLASFFPEEGPGGAGFAWILALFVMAAVTAAIWTRGTEGEPLLSVSTTVFGAIYTGGLLSYALFLRHLPATPDPWHGTALAFAPVLLTWASDTFAYFVGRAFGKRRLIPRVSPGKTVEGSLGALAGTVAVAVAYTLVLARFPTFRMGVAEAVAFGVLMSVSAQVGDLAESLLKRDAGVKDSGALLPGHGGALDRFDSLLFTLPLAYLYFRFVVGAA